MATPNQMPKRPNRIHQQIVGSLIHTLPSVWKKKTISKDDEGKEVLETSEVRRHSLRNPLAQNVSDLNVERAARRWL